MSHFAPFGDAVACGQLAIVKVSEVSSPSKIEGELPLGQKGRFFLSEFFLGGTFYKTNHPWRLVPGVVGFLRCEVMLSRVC